MKSNASLLENLLDPHSKSDLSSKNYELIVQYILTMHICVHLYDFFKVLKSELIKTFALLCVCFARCELCQLHVKHLYTYKELLLLRKNYELCLYINILRIYPVTEYKLCLNLGKNISLFNCTPCRNKHASGIA